MSRWKDVVDMLVRKLKINHGQSGLKTRYVPATAALALVTFAPSVSASSTQFAIPEPASLTLATFAPLVTGPAPVDVTPITAALTVTTFAPSLVLTLDQVVIPTTRALSLTRYVPTINNQAGVVIPTAALVLSRFAPTVAATAHQTLVPSTRALTLATFAPTVSSPNHLVVTPTTKALATARFAPTISGSGHQLITPSRKALIVSRYAPIVTFSTSGPTWYISPSGSDTIGTGTIANPWRTISKFLAKPPAPGDTLYCRGGTYTGTTRTTISNPSGSSGNPITVRNYPSETPVFAGPGAASYTQFIRLAGGVSYWVFDGLTLQNFKAGSAGIIDIGDQFVSTHHHVIRNCRFTMFAEGTGPFNHCVYLSYYADDCTVENNVFVGTSSFSFDGEAVNVGDHEPSPRRFLIQRNVIRAFYGNGGGIWVNGNISDGSIVHNTFMAPARFFVRTPNYASAGAVIVRDNAGGDSDGAEIVDAGPGITADHNYWNETLNADGSLTAGSPAINGAHDGTDAGAIDYP